MKIDTKVYDLHNGFGIECTTKVNEYTNRKTYSVSVVMLNVEWHDIVKAYTDITSPDEANTIFKVLYNKYVKL